MEESSEEASSSEVLVKVRPVFWLLTGLAPLLGARRGASATAPEEEATAEAGLGRVLGFPFDFPLDLPCPFATPLPFLSSNSISTALGLAERPDDLVLTFEPFVSRTEE